MSFRIVNGNDYTEDGWRCCWRDECDVTRIPGLTLVDTAPIRKGAPLIILGAWLFWYDRNVEEILSSVWGWSEDNDVLGQPGRNNGSNHLSATAVDVNAPRYPWGTYRMSADKIAKVEEGLRLFPPVFWGRVWNKPDEMHYQMRWREGDPRNEEFANKLLAGYLGIYKPGPTTPSAITRTERYALAFIAEGQRRNISPRGIQIAFSVAFVESEWKIYANTGVPESMVIPHDAEGRDHDSIGILQQRCPMWGPANVLMDPTLSVGLFYDRLVKMDYNNPNILPGDFAANVQNPQKEYRGRYQQRMGEAVDLYNRLVGMAGEGFLMALSDQEQRNLYNAVMNNRPSRSPLRDPGDLNGPDMSEVAVGDAPDQIWDLDGSVHILVVYLLASLEHPGQLALLRRVAAMRENPGKYPNRQSDAELANNILAELTAPEADVEPPPPRVMQTTLIPAAPVRKEIAAEEYMTDVPEIIPAQNSHVQKVDVNTMPEDLLGELERLDVFNKKYRILFDKLTQQPEEKK